MTDAETIIRLRAQGASPGSILAELEQMQHRHGSPSWEPGAAEERVVRRTPRIPDDWRPITGNRRSDWYGLFHGEPEASLVAGLVGWSLLIAAIWGAM